jgi:hypothetical protein
MRGQVGGERGKDLALALPSFLRVASDANMPAAVLVLPGSAAKSSRGWLGVRMSGSFGALASTGSRAAPNRSTAPSSLQAFTTAASSASRRARRSRSSISTVRRIHLRSPKSLIGREPVRLVLAQASVNQALHLGDRRGERVSGHLSFFGEHLEDVGQGARVARSHSVGGRRRRYVHTAGYYAPAAEIGGGGGVRIVEYRSPAEYRPHHALPGRNF